MKASKTSHCEECPSFSAEGRCVGTGPACADIVFVGGAPRPETAHHDFTTFSDDTSALFKKVFREIQQENPELSKIKHYYIHAAQCILPKEDAETVKHCRGIVHKQIALTKAKVVVPLGNYAMKSLDIGLTISDARGKRLNATVCGHKVKCMPTYSPGVMFRKESIGLLRTFKADIKAALKECLLGTNYKRKTMEELTKDYLISKTVEDSIKHCKKVLAFLHDNPKEVLAIDTETTGLQTWLPDFKTIAFSFAWGKGQSAAMLYDHREQSGDFRRLDPYIKAILESPNPKTFHNYQYDFKVVCLAMGWKVENVVWDSMQAEYLLDENKKGLYGLKVVTKTRVPEFTDYEKMIKVGEPAIQKLEKMKEGLTKEQKALREDIKKLKASKKAESDKEAKKKLQAQIRTLTEQNREYTTALKQVKSDIKREKEEDRERTFEDIDVDAMLLYAAIDTDCTRQISIQQSKEVGAEDPDLASVMQNLMIPASRVLGRMEHEGINIDHVYLAQLEREFAEIAEFERKEVYRICGKEFNLNSPQQLANILIMDRGIKLTVKTKKSGDWQLNDDVLSGIDDELVKHVQRYRKASKAKDTFLKGIREKSSSDGRLHCSFNQTTTATGRLSSSGPNMQNVPSKILGKNIKKLFIPDDPENEVFVDADYSGAEIRILCAYARDENLIKTLNDGRNIHSHVASEIYDETYEDIQGREKFREADAKMYASLDHMRQVAKAAVFLTIYGGGAQKLHESLVQGGADVTLADCENIINTFLDRFPVIRQYMEGIKRRVDLKGYVKTHFGRRRRFPFVHLDWKMRNAAYREGINSPIQSTSSDLVLDRIIDMMDHQEEIGMKMRITVHDSFAFCMPKSLLDGVVPFIIKYAEEGVTKKFSWMPVPFICEASYGPSYGECTNHLK